MKNLTTCKTRNGFCIQIFQRSKHSIGSLCIGNETAKFRKRMKNRWVEWKKE